ncbi:hypothetical protein [Burkholderia sp. GS2Y]|uniref:Uncharacterized protein n=1 Tax=Burkholderia theae TaxID=3143496 RepID=A0ABU9WBK0_9BURK
MDLLAARFVALIGKRGATEFEGAIETEEAEATAGVPKLAINERKIGRVFANRCADKCALRCSAVYERVVLVPCRERH